MAGIHPARTSTAADSDHAGGDGTRRAAPKSLRIVAGIGIATFALGYLWPLLMVISCVATWLLVTRTLASKGYGAFARHLLGALAFGMTALLAIVVGPRVPATHTTAALEACVDRGIRHFQSIGSYPTLTSAPNVGRRAAEVARERCERTAGAF